MDCADCTHILGKTPLGVHASMEVGQIAKKQISDSSMGSMRMLAVLLTGLPLRGDHLEGIRSPIMLLNEPHLLS